MKVKTGVCTTPVLFFSLTFPTISTYSSLNNITQRIIKQASRGDNKARSWLYQKYSQAMYNICVRMTGDVHTAQDVLQDAFILAFKNLKQVKNGDRFGGWLRRIVINECIRHSKKTVSWQTIGDIDQVDDDPLSWWSAVSLATLHNAIKGLPAGCRQVFVLYVLEDFTHKEIADNLGISESTSKSQYQRARKLLRDKLLKDG